MLRRFLCCFLVMCLLALPFAAPAHALVVVDDIIVAAVIAFGAACGLTLIFSGLDADGAIAEVRDLLDDYLVYLGIASLSAWIDGTAIIALDGLINLPADIASAFSGFWGWVQDRFSVAPDTSVEVSSGVTATFPPYNNSYYYKLTSYAAVQDFFAYVISSGELPYSVSLSDTVQSDLESFFSDYADHVPVISCGKPNDGNNRRLIKIHPFRSDLGEYDPTTYLRTYVLLLSGTYYPLTNTFIVTQAGAAYSDPVYPFEGKYTDEDGFYFSGANASVAGRSVTVSASDTIDIPQDIVYPGWIDVGASTTDTLDEVTDLVIDQAIEGELVPTLTISDTAPVPPSTPSPSPGLPDDLPLMPEGVLEKFPFSIPFDVLAVVSALDVEPVAPRLEVDLAGWGLPGETIVLDLSQYDAAAAVCRSLELVLLGVGLAVATRRIYLRG